MTTTRWLALVGLALCWACAARGTHFATAPDAAEESAAFPAATAAAEPEEDLLWSGSFGEVITGLYGMYAEAARSIAAGAGIRLSTDEVSRLGGARPIDPATYEAYLRGMHHLYKNTPDDIQTALRGIHAIAGSK